MSDLNEDLLNDDEDYGDLEVADEEALLRDDEDTSEDVLDIADEDFRDSLEDSGINNSEVDEEKTERKDKFATERQRITAPEAYSEKDNIYQKREKYQKKDQKDNNQRFHNSRAQNGKWQNRQNRQNNKPQNMNERYGAYNKVLSILNRGPGNNNIFRQNQPQQQFRHRNQQSKTVLINPHFRGVVTVETNNAWSNNQPIPQQPQYQPSSEYQEPFNQWSQQPALQGPPVQQYGQMADPMHMQRHPQGQLPMQAPPFQGGMQVPPFQGGPPPMQGPPFQGGPPLMQRPQFQGEPPTMQAPMQRPPFQGSQMQEPMGQGLMQRPQSMQFQQPPMQGPMNNMQPPMQDPMNNLQPPMQQGPMNNMQPSMFQNVNSQPPYQNGPPVQNNNPWNGQQNQMYPIQPQSQQTQNGPPVQNNNLWNGQPNQMYAIQPQSQQNQFQQSQAPPMQSQPDPLVFMQPLPPGAPITDNFQPNNFQPPPSQNQNFQTNQNPNFGGNPNWNQQNTNNNRNYGTNQARSNFNQKRKSGGEANLKFLNKKKFFNKKNYDNEVQKDDRTPEVKIGHRPAVVTKTIEDDDPQTRDLRQKIEEQRQNRQQILKWKEERRKQAKNLTPIIVAAPEQQNVFKKKSTNPTNVIEIRTGNYNKNPFGNNICLTNGKKITKFQKMTQAKIAEGGVMTVHVEEKAMMPSPDLNEIDERHLSNFLADRKILAKDETLMDTRAVFIKNIASSTQDKKILTVCKTIGNVQKLHRDKNERHATIVFKSVASAHAFFKKYQRHMLDLSVIEVTLKPMSEVEQLL